MNFIKPISFIFTSVICMDSFATDFSFDRPGAGFGTGITPIGRLAWEQSLPSLSYTETKVDGAKVKTITLNEDMLFRTGLTANTELQLGWQGPAWTQTKYLNHKDEQSGFGDLSIGIKKAIDLTNEKFALAFLAQTVIATGNDEFTEEDNIYSIGSSLDYEYTDLINTNLTLNYELQDGVSTLTVVPTLGYQFTGKLSGFSELVFSKKESYKDQYALGTGLVYAFNERTQFDGSIGIDLNDDGRSYNAGLGISFLF